ncbi:hypothetical protein Btru_025258 [Bulinus truncatus]|nr:hypothetical protein Btru_025258 [Bulinus truncatus]
MRLNSNIKSIFLFLILINFGINVNETEEYSLTTSNLTVGDELNYTENSTYTANGVSVITSYTPQVTSNTTNGVSVKTSYTPQVTSNTTNGVSVMTSYTAPVTSNTTNGVSVMTSYTPPVTSNTTNGVSVMTSYTPPVTSNTTNGVSVMTSYTPPVTSNTTNGVSVITSYTPPVTRNTTNGVSVMTSYTPPVTSYTTRGTSLLTSYTPPVTSYTTRGTSLLTSSTPPMTSFSTRGTTSVTLSTSTAKPVALRYNCPVRCQNQSMINLDEDVTLARVGMFCLFCKCDQTQCRRYDMCCPDIAEPYVPLSQPHLDIMTNFSSTGQLWKVSCELDPFYTTLLMLIASCPKNTGANDSVRELCESDLPIQRVNVATVANVIDVSTDVAYKNVYCAICNNVTSFGDPYDDIRGSYGNMIDCCEGCCLSLMEFLLNFNSEAYIPLVEPKEQVIFHYVSCLATEWSTPNGECLPLHCTPGKLLKNSSCVVAFPEIWYLQYFVNLWLTPVDPSPNISLYYPFLDLLADLNEQITNWVTSKQGKTVIRLEMFGPKPHAQDSNATILIKIDGVILSPPRQSRDSFEPPLLSYFVNNLITLNTAKANFTFKPLQAISRVIPYSTCRALSINRRDIFCDSFTNWPGYEPSRYYSLYPPLIEVNDILLCPHVIFNQSYYELEYSGSELKNNYTVTIDLNVTKLQLSDSADLNSIHIENSGDLRICRELLDRKLEEIQNDVIRTKRRELTVIDRVQNILSLFCTALSLLCLLLTVLTYGALPALRTAAGKNNMMLALSLLLAQTFSQLAVYVKVSGPPCTALGVITHGLWLWMFTWTFICSYHMFRVFTAKTRSAATPGSDTRDFIRRCGLSLLPPAVIISAVVVGSYIRSGGKSIGYSPLMCWFESLLITVVAFACPLFIVVLCNIDFLVITVVKIHRVRQLSSTDSSRNKESHNNLLVYVKLSVITGIFWILALVTEVSGNVYIRLITIPIFGLEGVYIFFSYVCKLRVLKQLAQRFSTKPDIGVTLTSAKTTSIKAQESIFKA